MVDVECSRSDWVPDTVCEVISLAMNASQVPLELFQEPDVVFVEQANVIDPIA